ncbi:MAG: deoxyribodipyrimidine photo-lyase [Culicoidibacterales bacterium]
MSYIKTINQQPINSQGEYVLYWAHAAIRTRYNQALNYACACAKQQGKRLQIVYQLVPNYPQANQRHFYFLLAGLREFVENVRKLGCDVTIICETDDEILAKYCEGATLVISDTSYLRYFQYKQSQLAQRIQCQFIAIETNIVVPVRIASPKQEYTAGTFRPKIQKQLATYLQPIPKAEAISQTVGALSGEQWLESAYFCEYWQIDSKIKPVAVESGESAAQQQLQNFLKNGLYKYGQLATAFDDEASSQLSAYLHFGHVSPLDIALQVQNTTVVQSQIDNFLEQVIVRRELAINYVFYCPTYDQFQEALPNWARETLAIHDGDQRIFRYTFEQLEQAQTHDEIWNQAQNQLIQTGRMNNYLRMYWGKKVMEWTVSHQQAWQYLQQLNDAYELDGRDPNGYVGIAWCFGLHDRAWSEREIFGKTRYMNETGVMKRRRLAEKVE